MSQIIRIQPAAHVDHITDDGTELTKMPYPYFADQEGNILKQEFWNGNPKRVVGFARDLSVQQIDLWWWDAFRDPRAAVGMYLVTEDKTGQYASHQTAVESMDLMGDIPVQDGQTRTPGQDA